ncbi:probable serine/threonine-protein kinase DDB_G0281745 isoform X1 [Lytechinus variegatus]|uniref:probable serine/threonine-protein kinase DDB_G0281745 isoform X1 n=1 Tax=Lytechinus variegatus TaxID=7654 RepID=UPI001BB26A90|nr:probable serine/threonine-protein kinase DDB_G0281745 isoform X1 [Lytechinus variegatus]
MDSYSLSSSSSSLMSEITELFPELKTTCDSIEVLNSHKTSGDDSVIQDGCETDDVFEKKSSSYSNRLQVLNEAVIKKLSSKVKCQRLTMKDVGTFDKCKRVKKINDLQEIGRGTYGRVLLGRHIQTKRALAIKQSCRSQNHHASNEMVNESNDAISARVQKEAVVHLLLSDSQYFPRFLGTLDLDNDPCLAIEFVGNQKSGTAFSLLEPPPLSVANGLDIAEDVVRGMMELHDQGLLHNDLKTDNVLLEKRGHSYHAVIIDFGMVSTISSPLRMTELPEELKVAYIHGEEGDYVAPEVVLHGQSTSISSDVFSVGKILEDITKVVEDRCPLLKDLTSLAIKCMKRNPQSRSDLPFVLDHITSLKKQVDRRQLPLWKRLVKKHR